MKLFAAVLLSVFTAFSVSNVKRTAPNTYTATKNVVTKAETDPVLHTTTKGLPASLVIATTDCQHVTVDGETGILLTGPEGTTIIFSHGAACHVSAIGAGPDEPTHTGAR